MKKNRKCAQRKSVPVWNAKKGAWDWLTPEEAEQSKAREQQQFAQDVQAVMAMG